MQRYRVVILIVLFGILPVAAAFVFALFFLEEPGPAAEPAPVAETAPVAEEPPPPEPEPEPEPEKARVLAAVRPLPVGSLLRADDLVGVDLDLDPDAARRKYVAVGEDGDDDAAAESLRGYAIQEAVPAGHPLGRRAVVGPGQRGFLAVVLEPGTRAVAIEVGSATSQAGLIDPGDRVDVILTAELPARDPGDTGFIPDPDAPEPGIPRPLAGGSPGEAEVLARTIVEDARVVAIDRTTEGVGGPRPYGEGEEVSRGGITTATLEVLPGEDDRLVLGGRVGRLSLVIRSLRSASLAGPGGPLAGRRRVPGRGPGDSTPTVNLREILRPRPAVSVRPPPRGPTFEDMAALEDRLLAEFGSMEESLRAAAAAEEEAREPLQEPTQVVRIFRGSAPAERVCFRAGAASSCPDRWGGEESFDGSPPPGAVPSPGLPLHDHEGSPE